MALIAIAVYDTEENGRSDFTDETLASIYKTVDMLYSRIIIYDNGSCKKTAKILSKWAGLFTKQTQYSFSIIHSIKNVGTARAINQCWMYRKPNEVAIKMDNDVRINYTGWVSEMEEVFHRDPSIGIVGLKRKDCMEEPKRPVTDFFHSELTMLDHKPGERWIIVEEANHIMGTCQAYSPALLEKIGYLYQMGGLYGFDDSLASVRAHVAGFRTVFLSHIDIDHIDPGGTDYQKWKEQYAGERMAAYNKAKEEIRSSGKVYYGPEEE